MILTFKKISDKKNIKYDNPVIIVLLGYLAIFVLAIPYYYKFNIFSLLNVFLVIFLLISSFALPFLLNVDMGDINKKINLSTFSKLCGLLLVIIIFYGVFVVMNSILFATVCSLFVIGISNLFIKYKVADNGQNIKNKQCKNYCKFKGFLFKNMDNIIFAIGIMSFMALVIIHNAIPLFNYPVRMSLSADPLRLISMGALVYGGINNIYYFIIAFILLILLGYKMGVLIVFIAFLIYKYQTKKIKIKYILLSIMGLIGLLALMSKAILYTSNQNWNIGVFGILSYRAYFDMMVLEKIINYPYMLLGTISLNPIGEGLIATTLLGYSNPHNITSTLFGPILLDFGLWGGLLFAFLLGLLSKLIYEGDRKLYAIYASILLSMCEVGINYGFLIVMFVMLYVNSKIIDTKK